MSEPEWTIRVAVQHGPAPGSGTAAALEHLQALAPAARRLGAELLVLPQLYLGGRPEDDAAAHAMAELSDGPGLRAVGAIARAAGLALLCGYVELCSGRCHDSLLFVDAHGHAIANYRRVHLRAGQEVRLFARGQWLNLVPFAGRRLGLLTGIDIDGPEQARALALAGADLLLVAGGHAGGPAMASILVARAAENGCGLAFANAAVGADAPASCVIGPDGAVLAQTGAGLAVATLPAAGPGLSDRPRRPQLYARLVAAMVDEDGPRL